MKLVSFTTTTTTHERYGILTAEGVIELGPHLGEHCPTLADALAHVSLEHLSTYAARPCDHALRDIRFLPVIPRPNKILCIGMNYAQKRLEFASTSDTPTLFVRFADSQTGHEQPLLKPDCTTQFDYEGEMAIVIGKTGRHIHTRDAYDYIAGYSNYMDGSVRDWQHDGYTAGKNWPQTGGFGPALVSRDDIPDPHALTIKTRVNGEQLQSDHTRNMIHTVPQIVSYISAFTQLSPGDVILTGSPGNVGKSLVPPRFLNDGDVVEVEIEGLGTLRNTIVDTPDE